MRNKKGKKGWMAVKIDLEKAYDRLKWEFIKETLEDIGVPRNIVDLIWSCISTSKMRVLWNGEALEEFSPSRGIRQGDPLSPYLFVLCIERLFQSINLAVSQEKLSPIRLSRGGPMLSHLAYADDLMLFGEATVSQAQNIKDILDTFCKSSSQKVSPEKTKFFFSKNVGWHVRQEVSEKCGFGWTDNLGKYLGVPILHNRASRATFQFIMDKVGQRLSNWKAKNLSFAGRVSLAKSVIQALPVYTMQSTLLPKSICEEIDKKCRSFICGILRRVGDCI
jgi:hypothetical protein